MCGIFGVVSKTHKKLDQPACMSALSALNWRGPDFSTHTFWKDRVFLGQSILSITGRVKSPEGQHLKSKSGRL